MSEAAPLLMRGEPGRAAVPAVETTLFRDEVLDQRQAQWLGTVLLAPRLSHRLFTLLASVAVAATIALLFFGEYARKARINGWLVPDLGLIQVFPPQSGLVTEVYAREGEEVQAGAPLLLLSTEVDSKVVGGTRKQIIRRLHERRTSLIAERERQKQLHQQQSEEGVARVAAITAERKQLQREIEAQRARAALGEKTAVQLRGLRAQQLVTEARLQSAEQDNLDQAVKLAATERALATLDQETLKLRGELRDLPLRHQTQLGEIERNMAALDQELAEAELRRQIQITAPQSGSVSSIQTAQGGNAAANVPLLSIVPAGSQLQAQLFGPSRSIGFVRPGQRVLLRYQAFPYQKFGFYEGRVTSVSRAALSPSELPQQLAGLTTLYGANEPIYRITVTLAKQTATAYGRPVALQPGMLLEADVVIERRSLIEWVLDPVFSLTGGRSQ